MNGNIYVYTCLNAVHVCGTNQFIGVAVAQNQIRVYLLRQHICTSGRNHVGGTPAYCQLPRLHLLNCCVFCCGVEQLGPCGVIQGGWWVVDAP
jgi:hypothetical protein